MYCVAKLGMWLVVSLAEGDILVIDGLRHLYWVVKRLPAKRRLRTDSVQDALMGIFQPGRSRLWAKRKKDGKYVHMLPLPPILTVVFEGDQRRLLTIVELEYGIEALGGGAFEWIEDTDKGRKLLGQRSFVARLRVAAFRDPS